MNGLRRLLCFVALHRWGDPVENGGSTYTEECKDCGIKQLVIRVVFEEK